MPRAKLISGHEVKLIINQLRENELIGIENRIPVYSSISLPFGPCVIRRKARERRDSPFAFRPSHA
jgi:hypothetical protein